MKKKSQFIIFIVIILVGLIALFAGSYRYVTKWRYTEIDTQVSPDERCRLTLQMKGEPEWPFGTTYGRIIVQYDGEIIQKKSFQIRDDGAVLRAQNWDTIWNSSGVQITLHGSEQDDEIIRILYDGTEAYEDFSDNDPAERFKTLTDTYFSGRNRAYDWKKTEAGLESIYFPIISLNSSGSEEEEWFCSDITNWLLYVMEELPYEGNEALYEKIFIKYQEKTYEYIFHDLQNFSKEHIAQVNHDLYDFIEEIFAQDYASRNTDKSVNSQKTPENIVLTEEQEQFYLSIQPDCSCKLSGGLEYRMLPVDRACGSSYYALITVENGKKNISLFNPDPYLGMGGNALWISFLDDGQTGFSCLTYNGGASSILYRTTDGGKTFETVEYPSAKAILPDGTYYNPFVIPEKIYQEDQKLYMEVGQGSDGDYYGKEGFCKGLYESQDNGRIWRYVKEIKAKR